MHNKSLTWPWDKNWFLSPQQNYPNIAFVCWIFADECWLCCWFSFPERRGQCCSGCWVVLRETLQRELQLWVVHARSSRTSAPSLLGKPAELTALCSWSLKAAENPWITGCAEGFLAWLFNAKGNCVIGYLSMFHCCEIGNFFLLHDLVFLFSWIASFQCMQEFAQCKVGFSVASAVGAIFKLHVRYHIPAADMITYD